MPSRVLFVVAILLGLSGAARAQGGGSQLASAAEIAAPEDQMIRDALELSNQGCAVACRALGSMARAADRICALDPGPRCAAARAKVSEASRKVHEACAECGAAGVDAPAHAQERVVQGKKGEAP